ncbi:MAG: class I SAM-dependent methyltransferase [Actinomycetaceae bacterium]|nr:class I SAM-dependent methyltransferase [Actinomycetaceae bacterium]
MRIRHINPWDLAAPAYRRLLSVTYPGFRQLYRMIRAQLQPSMNVLELGCGPGNISIHVAEACRHLTATDYAKQMIRQARTYNTHPSIDYLQADATNLPFEADSFDAAYTVNMLHIVSDPRRVLDEAARVLRPHGRLIAATFTRDITVRSRFAAQLAPLVGHSQFFAWTDDTYRQFFADAGWTVRRHATVRSLFQISIVVATPAQNLSASKR